MLNASPHYFSVVVRMKKAEVLMMQICKYCTYQYCMFGEAAQYAIFKITYMYVRLPYVNILTSQAIRTANGLNPRILHINFDFFYYGGFCLGPLAFQSAHTPFGH